MKIRGHLLGGKDHAEIVYFLIPKKSAVFLAWSCAIQVSQHYFCDICLNVGLQHSNQCQQLTNNSIKFEN